MFALAIAAFGPATCASLCGITSLFTNRSVASRSTRIFSVALYGPFANAQAWQPWVWWRIVMICVASAHGPEIITIRHQTRGCHAWAFAQGPYNATLKIRVDRHATLRVVTNRMMPP